MGFLRQEYWSGLSFPFPGDLPDPGIKSTSLTSPALAGMFFTTSAPWKAPKKGQMSSIFLYTPCSNCYPNSRHTYATYSCKQFLTHSENIKWNNPIYHKSVILICFLKVCFFFWFCFLFSFLVCHKRGAFSCLGESHRSKLLWHIAPAFWSKAYTCLFSSAGS